MNGNDSIERLQLDHEVRITKQEEAMKHLQRTVEEGFVRQERTFAEFRASQERALTELRASQDALRETMERNMAALRQEFHRDRRFSAMVFLTTQLAVIGALLRLAGLF